MGRNDPCPCGSGKKFKRCHGRTSSASIRPSSNEINAVLEVHKAKESRRQHQQGKGKPIISTEFAGHRVVAVGNRIHYSKRHKTFFDFLGDYIRDAIGAEWGNAELKKPPEERHQIIRWYVAFCTFQAENQTKPIGEIQSAPMNGLTSAYFGLAYNLYLLQHNAELQAHLISRLKKADQFYPAYYETYVAAWFALAGFDLKIENEKDSTRTHTEFIATKDARSYSVEAKARQAEKENFDVGNQLWKALRKEATNPRMVFIDLNVGPDIDAEAFLAGVARSISSREPTLKVRGESAPPAYVFATNQPFHLCLDEIEIPRAWLASGFKIPDFGGDVRFTSLIDAHKSRVKHADALAVQNAFLNYKIPVTFDGEIPEFTFGEAERRFMIGQRYELDNDAVGMLTSGTVLESEKKAYLIFNREGSGGEIHSADLSDAEIRAYKSHPETFFGRVEQQAGNIDNPIDMFEWFLDVYKDTPRNKILEWLNNAPDIKELRKLQDEELRLIYAERCALGTMKRTKD